MRSQSSSRSPRDHLLGVLLAAHLLAVVVMALPSTGGLLNRKAWKEPSVQREFAIWVDTFNAVGFDLTVEDFEHHLWEVASVYGRAHDLLRAPTEPYRTYLGTGQGWQMFPAPQTRPAVLHIEIRTGKGPWKRIYTARSDTEDWHRAFFDQDRVRTMMFLYTWPHLRRLFTSFANHLTPKVRQDFPEATEVRFGLWRYTTPTPAQARIGVKPAGKYELWLPRKLR